MDTKRFWENRFSNGLNLRTTGHRAFNIEYNNWLYKGQIDTLNLILQKNSINLQEVSLLDIGSGSGFFIDYFLNKGVTDITGVDITQASVDYLKKNYPSQKFYQCDISQEILPINDKFNIITAFSVLFHIVDDKKFSTALLNIGSMLLPGGFFIFSDLCAKTLLPNPKHVRMRNLSSYRPLLKESSMDIIDIIPMYYLLNRVYIPFLGPYLINLSNAGKLFYKCDHWLRENNFQNFGEMKLVLVKKA